VLDGAGVSVLPRYLCDEHIAAGRLRLLGSPAEPPINTLFLVWREGYLRPAARRVRARLLEAAGSWLPREISSSRAAGSAFVTVSPCAGDREVNSSGQRPRAAV
jgi:hypothetical protein